jgi:hypothetical protein
LELLDERMPAVPRASDVCDQTPSYSVAMLELSLAVAIPPGLPSGCFLLFLKWLFFFAEFYQYLLGSWGSAVRILTVLQAGRLRKLSILGGGGFLQCAHIGSGTHPASYSRGHGGVLVWV